MGAIPQSWAEALRGDPSTPIFGLAGSSNLRFLAQCRTNGAQVVQAQHETGAVAMAAGWAEATDGVGIASVHQGPGFTNAITALVDAHRGWLPLLLLAGHTDDPKHHQRIDTLALCDALGIAVVVPQTHHPRELDGLLLAAAQSKCPIVVLPPEPTSTRSHFHGPTATGLLETFPEDVVSRINAGRRLALIAGRGAVRSSALQAIHQLADHIDGLLLTTLPAHGAFAGNPRYAGSIGGFATKGSTSALQSCDVVITFGAALDNWSTAGGRVFGQDATVVRIDNHAPHHSARFTTVLMDATSAARQLQSRTSARSTSEWVKAAAVLASQPRPHGEHAPGLDPRQLFDQLDRLLPPQRRLVLDSGHFIALASMYLTTIDGPHLMFGQDFQSVGLGLARAIGAACSRDNRLTVAVIGDGGAAMSLLELATAVDLRLPVLVIIVNDAAYGAEVHDFQPLGVDVSVAQSPLRNWAAVASALGARSHRVRSLNDLEVLLDWLSDPQDPIVLDCLVNPQVDAASVMTPEGVAEWSCAE